MSLALLFPGQGAQHAAMLPWLDGEAEAAPALQALAATCGSHWRERLHQPGWMHTNAVAQPLLTAASLAAWRVLAAHLPPPAVVAGYSVGELAAFAAADVLQGTDAVALAAQRAEVMDVCAAAQPGGLLSLQGAQALAWAQQAPHLHVAIRISPERVLVGGTEAALQHAVDTAAIQGWRCTRLPIAIASHTPLLADAIPAFADRLAQRPLHPPRAAVVSNLHGSATRSLAVLGPALAGQLAHTVRWDDCMDSIAERGVRCVLEVGPGSTLSALWRERHPGIAARSVDEFRSAGGVVAWVREQLRR